MTAAARKSPGPRPPLGIEPRFAPAAGAFRRKRNVTSGMMMSSFGLKVGGTIFELSGRGRFVAQLPRERVDGLAAARKVERFDPGHGRKMREWIAMAGRETEWVQPAAEAYAFVGGLPA